ncbi:MAG: hypothetical protein AAF311_13420 [Pseudomonadota bacterium]
MFASVEDGYCDKVSTNKGGILNVLTCVEAFGPNEFPLAEVYAFENKLSALHSGNNNMWPKIWQQLQVLRDAGLVEFLGRGRYTSLSPLNNII